MFEFSFLTVDLTRQQADTRLRDRSFSQSLSIRYIFHEINRKLCSGKNLFLNFKKINIDKK
jgi:hypothetical protein